MARAVLIGSETYGLTGCTTDVALVDDLLRRRGFRTRLLLGPSAGRRSILDALDELIADTTAGDAAVIYYSGHGGRLARPDADERKAAGASTFLQFLVPTDMEQSAPDDFRGILAEELAIVQRRLVAAFDGGPVNATTILDCCHSSYMARNAAARPRSVDLSHGESRMFTIRGILDHVASLGSDADTAAGTTNPEVVRLAACQTEQSAFEMPSDRGGTYGAFTDALVTVLDEIGETSVPWATVGELVRRRVRSKLPEQRPEIEGPVHRTVFGSDSVAEEAALPLTVADGVLVIEAAALLGLAVGDRVRLVVPGGAHAEVSASVVEVVGGRAVLDVAADRIGGGASAIALPADISVPPMRVALGRGADRDRIADAIAPRSRLELADADVTVRIEPADERWQIADAISSPWRIEPYRPDEAGVADLLDEVEAIAVGQRLLDLPGGRGAHALPDDVVLTFATVDDDGRRNPLAPHGERISVGTPVALTIRNTASPDRFVWVFDVGVSGRSALVTQANPSGIRLGPTGDADDTMEVWRSGGEPLYWPADVPIDPDGRPESFVVITADRRNDLAGLASRDARGRRSPLDVVLDEVRFGRREAAPASDDAPLRYRLDRIEFVLVPTD